MSCISVTMLHDELSPTHLPVSQKPKRKKKRKPTKPNDTRTQIPDPPVLCISRNKHWKYISSYHGPWLQLPLELLESLLVLNLDPSALAHVKPPALSSRITHAPFRPRLREIDRGLVGIPDSPPDSPHRVLHPLPPSAPPLWSDAGKPTPPPIDPGVFRNVTTIRRLIDEAAELSVRASSGLSAPALGSLRAGSSSAWPPHMDGSGTGRNVAMSAMRVHRLRALAVQKLAAAYKADEIASSVMVMQGGSVFDDIAERVLKHDPNDADAKYVHFFHEKIPSRANRQLAESTTTQPLDELIATHPQRLEYYRTRGIVHCFRDEYSFAIKDFTYALKEARTARKGRTAHRTVPLPSESRPKSGKKKKSSNKSNGQAPPNGTSDVAQSTPDASDADPPLVHPSVSPDAPDPIEPQLLFLRGATYLQHALHLIESAILKLEGVSKAGSALDGTELRLCYLVNGRYGGVEIGNPDGPLGKSDGPKARAYRSVLAEPHFREDISSYFRKAIRDHERFLAHFDTLEGPASIDPPVDLARRVEMAFHLSEMARHGHGHNPGTGTTLPACPSLPPSFTTYHPLLVESHFSILVCQLMLSKLPTLLTTFARTAVLVDALEGYPVFLPPRSMAQAEFVEVLERLAAGWRLGVQPHSGMRSTACIRAIEPSSPSESETPVASTSTACTYVGPGPSADLDCIRMLLSPVAARQRLRASQAASNNTHAKKKPLNINIPLHGPRVEIVLAWLGAVHLVEWETGERDLVA